MFVGYTRRGCTLQATTAGYTRLLLLWGVPCRLLLWGVPRAPTGGVPGWLLRVGVHRWLLWGMYTVGYYWGAPCRRQKRPDVVNCFMHGSAVVVLLLLPPSFRSVTPRFTANFVYVFLGGFVPHGGIALFSRHRDGALLGPYFFRGSVPSLPSCFWE